MTDFGEGVSLLITEVKIDQKTIMWLMESETTGVVQYLNIRRRLLLREQPASAVDLILSRCHLIKLTGLGPDTLLFVITASSAES